MVCATLARCMSCLSPGGIRRGDGGGRAHRGTDTEVQDKEASVSRPLLEGLAPWTPAARGGRQGVGAELGMAGKCMGGGVAKRRQPKRDRDKEKEEG